MGKEDVRVQSLGNLLVIYELGAIVRRDRMRVRCIGLAHIDDSIAHIGGPFCFHLAHQIHPGFALCQCDQDTATVLSRTVSTDGLRGRDAADPAVQKVVRLLSVPLAR